jgi:hypothetical protein
MNKLLEVVHLGLLDLSHRAREMSRLLGETRSEEVTVLLAARVVVFAAEAQDRLQALEDELLALQVGEPET